jgi:hypothetical protein
MLKSLFILMLVGLMAAVGFYYENQAGESLATLEAGTDNILLAATAVRKVSEPERASDINCESLDLESLDCSESSTESLQTDDMQLKPLQH